MENASGIVTATVATPKVIDGLLSVRERRSRSGRCSPCLGPDL